MNADPDSQWLIAQLLLIVGLIILQGIFTAVAFSFGSVNFQKVESAAEEGDKPSIKLLKVLKKPERFVTTIELSGSFVGLLMSGVAASMLVVHFYPDTATNHWFRLLLIFIVTLIVAFFDFTFGLLYPKRIARNKAEKIAKISVGPINLLSKILAPLIYLLTGFTYLFAKITPIKMDDQAPKITREEMGYLIENGERDGAIESNELEMLKGIFSLDSKMAREVMVPRTDAFMIDIEDPQDENIDAVLNENFSRIPVYDSEKDNIIGILHLKNLLKAARENGFKDIDLQAILQAPLFVPETIWIDDLLYELKKTKNQMAVLLDEYGGVVGIVTLEDLLEEIVGEIDDESDEEEVLVEKLDELHYLVQGRMPIDKFNEVFCTDFEAKDVDTIAGFLLTELGSIPEEHEKLSVEEEGMTLITEEMEGSRLLTVKVCLDEPLAEKEIETVEN